jgi:hypothetical protein
LSSKALSRTAPLSALVAEKGDSPWQEQTQSWLKLQTEGNHASPTPQAVTPAERERSMQR